MLLSVNDLVKLVRSSVNVQIPSEDGSTYYDQNYLSMTDEDILLFIKLGITRAYPEVEDISELPEGSEFAIVLLAKIELYLKLAVLVAPKVDLNADNANSIKLDQRFQHYMKLVDSASGQYKDWLDKESSESNTVNSYDVLLSSRHYTRRNYEKQVTPKVRITIDSITSNSVYFRWKMTNSSHFARYLVFISESPIVDMYNSGAYYSDKISRDSRCVKSTDNIRDTYCEITGLTQDTDYYIAVVSLDRNQVFGFKETSFTTLEEVSDNQGD